MAHHPFYASRDNLQGLDTGLYGIYRYFQNGGRRHCSQNIVEVVGAYEGRGDVDRFTASFNGASDSVYRHAPVREFYIRICFHGISDHLGIRYLFQLFRLWIIVVQNGTFIR